VPEFWVDRHVLVTGGCGFIGSHLVEALLACGARVRVLDVYTDRADYGWLTGLSNDRLEIALGDVADSRYTDVQTEGVDTVFHLAALIGIPYSYLAPGHYVRTNIEGTMAILEAGRRNEVRRIVHTSTSETYGTAQFQPMNESHPLMAQSPYAATKIAADQLALSYHRSFGLPVAILRPFNTFGPRQSLRAIIPTLMAQALFAEEIVVGSLDPVRDMTYVSDTVEGFLGLARAEGVEGDVFNVGSGISRSVGEMLEAVQKVAGVEKPVRQDRQRVRPPRSEVSVLLCDYGKAAAAFGYSPSISFDAGLEHVHSHLLAHPLRNERRYHV
jgi:NAD dependent epimerase/dehydratase